MLVRHLHELGRQENFAHNSSIQNGQHHVCATSTPRSPGYSSVHRALLLWELLARAGSSSSSTRLDDHSVIRRFHDGMLARFRMMDDGKFSDCGLKRHPASGDCDAVYIITTALTTATHIQHLLCGGTRSCTRAAQQPRCHPQRADALSRTKRRKRRRRRCTEGRRSSWSAEGGIIWWVMLQPDEAWRSPEGLARMSVQPLASLFLPRLVSEKNTHHSTAPQRYSDEADCRSAAEKPRKQVGEPLPHHLPRS